MGLVSRVGTGLLIGGLLLASVAAGGLLASRILFPSGPPSLAETCLGSSSLVASLFGNNTTTQIRLSTADLKSQEVLWTDSASRLPAMFGSLLTVSEDGKRLAYVTADDEQLTNAKVMYLETAHPDQPRLIASEPKGLLPIRPVWSSTGEQLAFVVARTEQGKTAYHVLAGSVHGGPVLKIADLNPDTVDRLEASALCITPQGAVSVLPPSPSPVTGNLVTGRHTASAASPTPNVVATPRSKEHVGGIRCSLPALSQNDPRWKDHQMRPTGETLGAVGCAVTSAAMVLDYYSAELTPADLSDCLGAKAVPIYWSRAVLCTGGRVGGAVSSFFEWSLLDTVLAAGRPAIVELLGGPLGSHFVVVTSGGGDLADQYHIVDPWNGSSTETLGDYTRAGWTLYELVDFRGAGPGCGQLLRTGGSAAGQIDGVADGKVYRTAVKIRRHGRAQVTIRLLSHNQGAQDQSWKLDDSLTLAQEGNYQVIVDDGSAPPRVLSFTIDNTPPEIKVTFFNQSGSLTAPNGSMMPVIAAPAKFAISASDPLTGISHLHALLDNQSILDGDSIASTPTRALTHFVTSPGIHHLTYSATNAAGETASGQAYFEVPTSTINGRVPPSGPTATPTPTHAGGGATPPAVQCPSPLSSVTLTAVSGALTWAGVGNCAPYTGTITATYGVYIEFSPGDCVGPCPPNHWVYSTATYQVVGLTGTFQDLKGGAYDSVKYKLTLTDAMGHSAVATATG
jgi:hypothetical protein